jgi:hypothetical protein
MAASEMPASYSQNTLRWGLAPSRKLVARESGRKKEKQKTRQETGSALKIYFLDSFYVLEINYLYSLYLAISIRDSAFKALLMALFFDLPAITHRIRYFYCSDVNVECGC